MSAELPRILHGAAALTPPDCDALQARAAFEVIFTRILHRHAEAVRPICGKDDSIELSLCLRTQGDLISYLVFSMAEFRYGGEKCLSIDISRAFKDAEHFSPLELHTMAQWEEGQELGSRPVCDYYYGMESEPPVAPYVWRTDWDFHHGRGLALDQTRQYTPDEFCGLIMEDGGQQVEVGTREVCGLGILLAGAYPHGLPGSGNAFAT